MNTFLGISYFILGIVQCFAVLNGFIDTLGVFWGIIFAFLLGEVPVVGTIMGVIGSMNSWGWSLKSALLLFVGVPLLALIIKMIVNKIDSDFN